MNKKYVMVMGSGDEECYCEYHIAFEIDEEIEDIKKDFRELCWKTYKKFIKKNNWDHYFKYVGKTFDALDFIGGRSGEGKDYVEPEIYTLDEWFEYFKKDDDV